MTTCPIHDAPLAAFGAVWDVARIKAALTYYGIPDGEIERVSRIMVADGRLKNPVSRKLAGRIRRGALGGLRMTTSAAVVRVILEIMRRRAAVSWSDLTSPSQGEVA